MNLISRKQKKFINKTFSFIVFVSIVVFAFLFKDFLILQWQHSLAFYYVYEGDRKYKQGKLQDAINSYDKALKLFPEHVKARYNLGNIYVTYEDFNRAAECYEKALDVYPDFLNARISLGIILSQELIDLDRAIEEYKKVVKTKPFVINIPFLFSNNHHINYSIAIAYYNLGLAYKSKSLLAGTSPALVRECLQNAVDNYKKSLKYVPDSYDTHYNLALTLHLLGNYNEAIEEYCKAIDLEPMNYEAHYNLAILLRQKMMYKESIEELQKAGLLLDANGDNSKTRYIYQVLSDVSQRDEGLSLKYTHIPDQIEKEPSKQKYEIAYKNGKVVLEEKSEKSIIDDFKNCKVCSVIKY